MMLLSRLPWMLSSSGVFLPLADFNLNTQNQTQVKISRLLNCQKKKSYFQDFFCKEYESPDLCIHYPKQIFFKCQSQEEHCASLPKIKHTHGPRHQEACSLMGTYRAIHRSPSLFSSMLSHFPLLFSPSFLPHQKRNVYAVICLASLEWHRKLVLHH